MKLAAILLGAATLASAPSVVSVAYAGSLVSAMEGPFAHALRAQTGITFSGEGKGSRALAHFISAGLRSPDVFISADPSLMRGLVRSCIVFASARMVVAYSPRSPHAAAFAAAASGRMSLLRALTSQGVRVGRTDPRIDPKGARTVRAIALLGTHEGDVNAAHTLLTRAQVYPEEDLAVRVESGALDAGFFYSTETARPELRTVELPSGANLAGDIRFAIAQMPRAPHAFAARRLLAFVLNGEGKRILEKAGLHYFAHPQIERF